MGNLLQCVAGIVVLALVFIDVVTTTLTLQGHGPLSGRIGAMVSRSCGWLARMTGVRAFATAAGAASLVSLFAVWLLLVWAGWTLVFASDDGSVVHGVTGAPASLPSLVYYVGFTIITLGTGDYTPNGATWQLLTVVASASGFFVATMVITYALSVLGSLVEQRQLAGFVRSLGMDAGEMLGHAWDGSAYRALDSQLATVASQLQKVEKQLLAYPVLHAFPSPEARSNLALAAATLDDVASVLLLACPPGLRPGDAVLVPLRRAQDALLETLRGGFITAASEDAPLPSLPAALQPAGDAALRGLPERRRLLLGWVQQTECSWPVGPNASPAPR